jgi:hypothetical protein
MRRLFIIIMIALFSVLPIYSQVVVTGSLTHEQAAEKGSEYSGTITLQNGGAIQGSIHIYKTDYQFYADGRILYPEPGSVVRSNSEWIQIRSSNVTIEPEQTRDIYYRVQVPEDVTGEGTFWSMIMIESEPSETGNPDGLMVRQVMRYAVQIVTQIGKGGSDISVTQATMDISDESLPVLVLDVVNTGSRWIHPDLSVELFSAGKGILGPFKADRKRIYPDTSIRFLVPLTDIPKGEYQAMAVFDSGEDGIFAAQYGLELR